MCKEIKQVLAGFFLFVVKSLQLFAIMIVEAFYCACAGGKEGGGGDLHCVPESGLRRFLTKPFEPVLSSEKNFFKIS
jgi:hypothetical protein